MAILAVENLDIIPFKGMNKTFRNGTISFIAGANNSYKTLLIKVLSGIVKTEEKIRVNRTFVEQITTKQYPYQIQVIFEDENFKTTTVKEEIILYKDKIIFICMTNNLDVPLYFGEVDLSILDKGRIVKEGDILSVLDDDSMLNKLGFRLPFMIDLSLKLKYYNLVDKIILDQKEMVEMLWK